MCVFQTYTGKLFHPLDPRPNEICIEDIAHALSMICRFTGHCSRFYSVAEHSVNVARLVEPRFKLRALLHDAAEAYLGDVSSPLKQSEIMDAYVITEGLLSKAIKETFGAVGGKQHYKTADRAMTGFEGLHLLKRPLLDADGWKPYIELAQAEPLLRGFELRCYWPEQAKYEFLRTFEELTV